MLRHCVPIPAEFLKDRVLSGGTQRRVSHRYRMLDGVKEIPAYKNIQITNRYIYYIIHIAKFKLLKNIRPYVAQGHKL